MAAVGARIATIEARLASLATPPAAGRALVAERAPASGQGQVGAAPVPGAAPLGAAPLGAAPTRTTPAVTFASVLAAATSSAPAPAPAAPVAPLTAAALRSHGNGRVPEASLTSIGGGERLWAPAAAAFTKMRDAARAQGVTLGVNDSYRSYEQQVDVAARKGLYSQGGLAAKPGTSDHGWGKALDLQLDGRAQAWMRANGGTYGFVGDTPREPWHWVYKA